MASPSSNAAQQSVHPTLGILARSQAFFYALLFFQSDGVPPPAPARVTQTVSPLSKIHMSENSLNYIPGVAVLILLITGLVETFLSATWNKVYFNSGVRLILREFQVDAYHSDIPSRAVMENKFKSGCFDLTNSLIFRKLDDNMYGFRERLLPIRRMSLMHGIVIFDEENNRVTVKGFFDWAALCFVAIWLLLPLIGLPLSGMPPFGESIWFALIYFGILFVNLGIFYLIDWFRFSAVAEFAAQSWSRKYVNTGEG